MGRHFRTARFALSVFPLPLSVLLVGAIACRSDNEADAFGNFEAEEVAVSAQVGGQLRAFTPVEGERIARGVVVGIVDTTQAGLELSQIIAQRSAVGAKVNEAGSQVGVFEAQRAIAERNYNRTRRLYAQKAATAQQLDQAERDYRVVVAQIAAARAARRSVGEEAVAQDARVRQIRDKIAKSSIINPINGTVIASYAHPGENILPGQPLYKISSLDTLTFRAYVGESQLAGVRIGQSVTVHVDRGGGKLISAPGVVTWVASRAEFTPTPVQTRDERADLVYQVKVRVPNPRGEFKIGMPGDLVFSAKSGDGR